MKKLISFLVLLMCSISLFAGPLEDAAKALEDSNKKLTAAAERIKALETERDTALSKVKDLEKKVLNNELVLAEASKALKESNDILAKANERITKDQEEITMLRKRIIELIKSGIEIDTYHFEIMLTGSYPLNVGFEFAYNFHFLPQAGILVGFNYTIETQLPMIFLGLKINLR